MTTGRSLADPLACYDCGLLYSDPGWCDTFIPTPTWLAISPTGHEGGVLCLTCIARRLVAAGIEDVPLKVTSGPWAHAVEDVEALRERAEKAERDRDRWRQAADALGVAPE